MNDLVIPIGCGGQTVYGERLGVLCASLKRAGYEVIESSRIRKFSQQSVIDCATLELIRNIKSCQLTHSQQIGIALHDVGAIIHESRSDPLLGYFYTSSVTVIKPKEKPDGQETQN